MTTNYSTTKHINLERWQISVKLLTDAQYDAFVKFAVNSRSYADQIVKSSNFEMTQKQHVFVKFTVGWSETSTYDHTYEIKISPRGIIRSVEEII